MDIFNFNPIHLKYLKLSKQQQDSLTLLSRETYIEALIEGESYTININNEVIACVGIYPYTDNIGKMWALLSENSGKHMLALTRLVKGYCVKSPYARLETTVRTDYELGHRWAELLGFVCETPDGMRNYSPDLQTYSLYSYWK